ncbi:hypothetical protein Bca4012_016752 [Brassica carinata]|uniref:Peptidyl-tRNA hydrolase n=1 Tax=Brassica carinata TaxID=52824 RepID=A0A8X7WNT9_BRACI|nr:hypothetical protein Bca52824_004841 [Brassica carinata]
MAVSGIGQSGGQIQSWDSNEPDEQFKAIMGQEMNGNGPNNLLLVLLTAPLLTFDQSGPLAAYYKLPLNRVLVVHDDMQLPCGVLRLQEKGGHGCHNGLKKSVMHHFGGNKEFARLRIGIGKPPGQMDPKAFLLQKFSTHLETRLFNVEQKYKHSRQHTIIAPSLTKD